MNNPEKEYQDDLKEQFEKKFITFNTAGFRCLKGEGEEMYEFLSKALDSTYMEGKESVNEIYKSREEAYKEGQRDAVREISDAIASMKKTKIEWSGTTDEEKNMMLFEFDTHNRVISSVLQLLKEKGIEL